MRFTTITFLLIWGIGAMAQSQVNFYGMPVNIAIAMPELNTQQTESKGGWRRSEIDGSIDQVTQQIILSGSSTQIRFAFRLTNAGETPITNPVVSYDLDTSFSWGPFPAVFPMVLAPGADTILVHPQTQPAIRQLNGKEVCIWLEMTSDVNPSNDTACMNIANIGVSVVESKGMHADVFPNPSKGEFQVSGWSEGHQLRFIDLRGRVYEIESLGEGQFAIPRHIAAGIYVIELQMTNYVKLNRLVYRP
jgi:hypothetical protein